MATIKGIKVGQTTITASYGGLTSSQTLTVTGFDLSASGACTISGLSNVVYNGNAQKTNPTVKATVNGNTVTLTSGTDYTVTWNSSADAGTCKAVGTITVTVTGTGNYTGSKTATYQITAASFTVSEPDQSYVYNGAAQGAAITVSNLKGGQTATIKYRTTSSGDYNLNTAPQITNVADSKTIYW